MTHKTCIYCGKPSESIDHLLPQSRGGLSVTENCVPACLACNGHKSDADAFEWYRRQRFYDPRRAMAIRAWLGPERLRHSAMRLDGLSVIVLMIFAIPLMDGIVARAHADPLKLAGFVAGAFAGMILCNAVTAAVTLPFLDRRTALTAGYCSGGRHNALLMAVLPLTVDPDIFLFIAAVQVPIAMVANE